MGVRVEPKTEEERGTVLREDGFLVGGGYRWTWGVGGGSYQDGGRNPSPPWLPRGIRKALSTLVVGTA